MKRFFKSVSKPISIHLPSLEDGSSGEVQPIAIPQSTPIDIVEDDSSTERANGLFSEVESIPSAQAVVEDDSCHHMDVGSSIQVQSSLSSPHVGSSSQVQFHVSPLCVTVEDESSSETEEDSSTQLETPEPSSKRSRVGVDLTSLPSDPGLRIHISDYPPNVQESIRRAYLLKGPFQPILSPFPSTIEKGKPYRFGGLPWYKEFGWLEYSVVKNSVFCLYCYLFKPKNNTKAGGNSFVTEGFCTWSKKERLEKHVGGLRSSHNFCYNKALNLINPKQSIQPIIERQSDQSREDYRLRLYTSVRAVRYLLRQALPFRGHDESRTSINQGNYLELLQYSADSNEAIDNVILRNAPQNCILIAPEIQKEIVKACAVETTNLILEELGGSFFSILVDESRDISIKDQMAVVIRYVNKHGCVVERFLGIVHVSATTAIILKKAIEKLLSDHGLCLSRLRGQGYDGASNMQGEYNGLKALILKENGSAYFVHCFAHRLQLALVGASTKVILIAEFFNSVSKLLNVVLSSCKRREALREAEVVRIYKEIQCGDLLKGSGLNQEMSLKRPGDTRWGSHYDSLLNMIILFPSIIEVLHCVRKDGASSEQRCEAINLLRSIQDFDFIFILLFMKNMLGITNNLSQALQRRDQDIVNAMTLVKIAKQRLQAIRDDDWDSLLCDVTSFCTKYHIKVLNMDDIYSPTWRPQRQSTGITNLHHYRADVFYKCVDWQRQELDFRFDEVNMELLLCMACLDPRYSFVSFSKEKLIQLAKCYPNDFSLVDLMKLEDQLENYIIDVRSNDEFLVLNGVSDLAKKMVETKKSTTYPLVFLLITLTLILPVATATVERAFSAMHIIKSNLRNRMGDEWLNGNMVTYIERDIFNTIPHEAIMQRFQKMGPRRGQL